ncbi:MAG: GNAT family N-acetyltransferase [Chloroflexota bacterium]|nr:GNAT family N-acetyltransferase [Chloroflexota bacterium]
MLAEDEPDPDDVKTVGRGLAAFNRQHAPEDDYRPLALFLRDPDRTIVGGLVGETFWGWLHVDLLWIREDLRGQGHGDRLLTAAEWEAVRRGCLHAFLETHSFQAPAFYRKRGYRPFGELPDFPAGHTRHFLSKRLPAKPTPEQR